RSRRLFGVIGAAAALVLVAGVAFIARGSNAATSHPSVSVPVPHALTSRHDEPARTAPAPAAGASSASAPVVALPAAKPVAPPIAPPVTPRPQPSAALPRSTTGTPAGTASSLPAVV